MSGLISKVLMQPIKMHRTIHTSVNIPIPVQIFHLNQLGVHPESFFQEHRPLFHTLKPDVYDARQEQLQFLMSRFKTEICNQALYEYYTLGRFHSCFKTFIHHLTPKDKDIFDAIVPYRFRALSSYELKKNQNNWELQRVANRPFAQKEAKVSNEKQIDFRQFERSLPELDAKYSQLPTFIGTVKGVAKLIESYFPKITRMDMSAHHIKVMTTKNRHTSNSPEGIHQDGFPFIVSALVVERHGIEGGDSEIFLDDKVTKIAKTCLQPGFGILQSDAKSDLWHHVTAIQPVHQQGFRSSLGFDIKIIE